MADVENAEDNEESGAKAKSKLPLALGLILGLVGGGGGYFAVSSGMILAPSKEVSQASDSKEVSALPDIAFVPVDPLVISLGRNAQNTYLRFVAQLEVMREYKEEVAMVMPRILDVLNGYLRAVEVSELEEPSALIRLRAQMLRRVQIVTGEGRVRDLLVMEFVLN